MSSSAKSWFFLQTWVRYKKKMKNKSILTAKIQYIFEVAPAVHRENILDLFPNKYFFF